MLKRCLYFSVILSLTACTTMVATSTLVKEGKWFDIGVRDGERGLVSRSMDELAVLARESGASGPNFVQYENGYQTGIDRYCDINNAYDIGLSGISYNGVCGNRPNGLQFQMDWQRGFADFQAADQSF